jgi:lysophospholipase
VRALLAGAGVIQAFDNRDPVPSGLFSGLKGLYQSFTYHSGVEAGSWLLTSLAGNDAATITSLVNSVWISSFSTDDFLPASARSPATYSSIGMDLVAKALSGYPPTLVDTWGRILSQHVLLGDDAGVKQTMSGIVNNTDFQSYNMPYPIFTALAIDPTVPGGSTGCLFANPTSPQYEFHPFEYGSWDRGIRTFARTEFMASPSANGNALARSTCVFGFDNLGFLLAASANEFNYWCADIPPRGLLTGPLGQFKDNMIQMTDMVHGLSFLDEYAIIPNSDFIGTSRNATSSSDLYLVSGASGGENVPLWPLIQPERRVDLIIANDNSQDTRDFFPNGTSLYNTYLRAQKMGLNTMPLIPTPEFFVERGYNRQPTFFGCYDSSRVSVLYLPNAASTFNSNIPDWILRYSSENVTAMLANGHQVATYGGSEVYKRCLGCFLLWKVSSGRGLPVFCKTCMDRFCYRP